MTGKKLLILAVVLAAVSASAASNAANTALISNFGITDNGGSWTMAFDLTNQGPAKDAIFFIQVSGLPSDWRTDPAAGYSVVTLGTPAVDLSDGTAHSWTGRKSGSNLQFKCGNGSSTGEYRIYGQPGAPSPNKNAGTGARFSWTFIDNGTSPVGFGLNPEMVKVHFQIIGDVWQNAGKSYTGGSVPEPSSLASLLALGLTAAGSIFRKSRNRL